MVDRELRLEVIIPKDKSADDTESTNGSTRIPSTITSATTSTTASPGTYHIKENWDQQRNSNHNMIEEETTDLEQGRYGPAVEDPSHTSATVLHRDHDDTPHPVETTTLAASNSPIV